MYRIRTRLKKGAWTGINAPMDRWRSDKNNGNRRRKHHLCGLHYYLQGDLRKLSVAFAGTKAKVTIQITISTLEFNLRDIAFPGMV